MSFETVSEESRLLRGKTSPAISHLDSKSRQSAPNVSDSRESSDLESRHLQINTYLKNLQDRGLFGWVQVMDYLSDQKRRNCRPNTLKSSFGTLALFLSFLKDRGHSGIETITREDLSSYIEYRTGPGYEAKDRFYPVAASLCLSEISRRSGGSAS